MTHKATDIRFRGKEARNYRGEEKSAELKKKLAFHFVNAPEQHIAFHLFSSRWAHVPMTSHDSWVKVSLWASERSRTSSHTSALMFICLRCSPAVVIEVTHDNSLIWLRRLMMKLLGRNVTKAMWNKVVKILSKTLKHDSGSRSQVKELTSRNWWNESVWEVTWLSELLVLMTVTSSLSKSVIMTHVLQFPDNINVVIKPLSDLCISTCLQSRAGKSQFITTAGKIRFSFTVNSTNAVSSCLSGVGWERETFE